MECIGFKLEVGTPENTVSITLISRKFCGFKLKGSLSIIHKSAFFPVSIDPISFSNFRI